MGERLDNAVSVVLIVVTIAIGGSVVLQALRGGAQGKAPTNPVYEEKWREALPIGQTVAGDSTSPIAIVTFTDLECPVCREFHSIAMKVMRDYPGQVRMVYVPYPLAMHRNAMGAARIANCVNSSDELGRWIAAVYGKQDSLGLKSWAAFAAEAQLPDTAAIARCASARDTSSGIANGLALGQKLGISSTPTVFVNGWRFLGAPSEIALDSMVRTLLRKQG
jgi:protein-disulfide isomerase